jgi:hypothetical protein
MVFLEHSSTSLSVRVRIRGYSRGQERELREGN